MLWIAIPIAVLFLVGKEGRRRLNRWAFRLLMLVGLVDLARVLTIGAGQPVGIFLFTCAVAAGAWFLMARYSVSMKRIEKKANEKRRRMGYVTAAPE